MTRDHGDLGDSYVPLLVPWFYCLISRFSTLNCSSFSEPLNFWRGISPCLSITHLPNLPIYPIPPPPAPRFHPISPNLTQSHPRISRGSQVSFPITAMTRDHGDSSSGLQLSPTLPGLWFLGLFCLNADR